MNIASSLDAFFRISERGSDIGTEIRSGFVTFLSLVYVLGVTPAILYDPAYGYPQEAFFTSVCVSCVLSCMLMGLYARFPVALAPSMATATFVSGTVVTVMRFSYPQAMMVVLVSGALFFILSVTGFREKLLSSIPMHFRYAITVGIGIFVSLIGLRSSGVIALSSSGVSLGDMHIPAVMLGLFSIAVTFIFHLRGMWSATIIGIVSTAVLSLLIGETSVPENFLSCPDTSLMFCAFTDFTFFGADMVLTFLVAVLSLLVVDMFDTAGTLLALGGRAGLIDDKGNIIGGTAALSCDSISTMMGATMGASNTTTFMESATGIEAGGRTGLVSVTVGLLFLCAMFMVPLFRDLISSSCTVGALMLVGAMMVRSVKDIEWKDPVIAVSSFMTMMMMPFTMSITNGMAFGFVSYVIGMAATGRAKEVKGMTWVITSVFLLYYLMSYFMLPSA
ncbi:MAG: NCS2 family permease [Candidatus Methanomethylophilaceae archaeon]